MHPHNHRTNISNISVGKLGFDPSWQDIFTELG